MRKATIVVVVILALLIVAVIRNMSLRKARPAFNDADLRSLSAGIPAQSNSFSLLLEAGKSLAVSEQEEVALGKLGNGSSWNEVEAKGFLNANEVSLALLRKAWACPQLQVEASTNFDQEFPYLLEWRQLTQLALIEARVLFRQGDEQPAFKNVMEVLRFGQHVEESGGGTLHYLVGSAIKAQTLECLRQFADTTQLPADRLLSVARQLGDFEASDNGLREALKVEYATKADMFDGFPSNVMTNSDGLPTRTPGFVYSARRSKAELAAQIRLTIAALTNYYAVGMKTIPTANTNISALRMILRGNAVGTILNEMSLSTREKLLTRKCRENSSLRATQTVLALRAFQKINGRNAQSLEELLPDFLESIPIDDFDGKPLRHSSDLKVVYSVGENLIDDGGVQSTNRLKSADLVFPIKF